MESIRQRAFTLIELLMVLAIIGVAAAITVPSFVRSIRGNRLRVAARTVVMAGRYARSMAIVKQQEFALVFDLENATVTVRGVVSTAPSDTGDETEEGVDIIEDEEVGAVSDTAEGEEAPEVTSMFMGSSDLVRELDGVHITRIEVEDKGEQSEGSCTVLYSNNGTCEAYELQIQDEHGHSVRVEVDALSGVTTERES